MSDARIIDLSEYHGRLNPYYTGSTLWAPEDDARIVDLSS